MTQQTINVGAVANDGTGDLLRDAFVKANANFTELYGIYVTFGTAAGANLGTSGATVPLLSTANTWGAAQTFPGGSSGIHIDGAAVTNRSFFGSTAGSARWRQDMGNNVSESGGNAGSDWQLVRFDDTGISLGTALSVSRANGSLSVNGRVIAGALASPIGVTTIATDADFTVTSGTTKRTIRHTGTLTANRTANLPSSQADGSVYRFARSGGGAFNLSVGGLKNLATGTWCDVEWDSGASAFFISASGSL